MAKRKKVAADEECYKKLQNVTKEERKKLIDQREQKTIMFEKDLNDKFIVYHEVIWLDDNTVETIYYYMDKNDDLFDEKTVIYKEKYSDQVKRRKAMKKFAQKKKWN